MRRHRSKPHTFDDQIAAEKHRLELELVHSTSEAQRSDLVSKIRQVEAAGLMNHWLRPAGGKAG